MSMLTSNASSMYKTAHKIQVSRFRSCAFVRRAQSTLASARHTPLVSSSSSAEPSVQIPSAPLSTLALNTSNSTDSLYAATMTSLATSQCSNSTCSKRTSSSSPVLSTLNIPSQIHTLSHNTASSVFLQPTVSQLQSTQATQFQRQQPQPQQQPHIHLPPPTQTTPEVTKPKNPSFYRRDLPDTCVHFNSQRGRELFREAVADGTMECYFPLSEQFLTQAEPAYCAISTLTMCLNAMAVDPRAQWRRPWRWFTEELVECCRPLSVIGKEGMTFPQFSSLARCNGVHADDYRADLHTIDHFREMVIKSATSSSVVAEGHASAHFGDASRGGLSSCLVVSYSRKAFNQTGDGHMSPIGGYHKASDSILVLDVARFKYPPYWVTVQQMWDAMVPTDKITNNSRGYCVLSPIPHDTITKRMLQKGDADSLYAERLMIKSSCCGQGSSCDAQCNSASHVMPTQNARTSVDVPSPLSEDCLTCGPMCQDPCSARNAAREPVTCPTNLADDFSHIGTNSFSHNLQPENTIILPSVEYGTRSISAMNSMASFSSRGCPPRIRGWSTKTPTRKR